MYKNQLYFLRIKLLEKILYFCLMVWKKFFSFLFVLSIWFSHLNAQEDTTMVFEPNGGVFNAAPVVKIKAPKGSKVFYTTDGSTPKSDANSYSSPLKLNKNTVIRAVYYLNGKKSNVFTSSYIFERDYHLPIVSIAIDPDRLWDESYGMLSYGDDYDSLPPYEGANFWKKREYPANIEHFEKDGKLAFNQIAGMRTFGQFSLTWPQRSLAIIARSEYGIKRFYYPIFPEKSYLDKYKSFILRNSGGDFSNTHLRDAFMTQLVRNLDVDIQAYKPAVVFINGEYWGIMNMREKLNEHYLKYNHGIHEDSVDILRHRNEKQHGTSLNYRKFLKFLGGTDFSDDENFNLLKSKIDLNNFLIYNISETYSDNRDAGGNIRYYKSYHDTARWRWMLYDLDLGLGINKNESYKHNTVKKFTSVNNEVWPDPPWSTLTIRKVLENKEGERLYITYFADMLNTVFHPDTAVNLLNKMAAVIEPEMVYHQKRWDRSYGAWKKNINHMKKFIVERPHYLRQFIMEKFDLKDTIYISIKIPEKKKGSVKLNTIELNGDFKGVYFTGVEYQAEVKTNFDYEFAGWGNNGFNGSVIQFSPESNVELKPKIVPKPLSVYEDKIIINEIHFAQSDTADSEDWIELVNITPQSISLDGWLFKDRNDDNSFIFPKKAKIDSFQYIILAKNPDLFKEVYSDVDTSLIYGGFDFNLSNEGELIRLYSNDSLMVDSLTFGIGEVWAEQNDSVRHLALNDPFALNHKPQMWVTEPPTPGKINHSFHHKQMERKEREAEIRFYKYLTTASGASILLAYLLWVYYKYKKSKSKI